MKKPFLLVICLSFTGLLFLGCVRMYSLPDAGPKAEWKAAEEVPAESREVRMQRFLDAKRVAVQAYAALAEKDWDKALYFMSKDSINFLAKHSKEDGAAAALESGLLVDGEQEISFDVLNDVFIDDLSDIVDEVEGVVEEEGPERKVLHAISGSANSRPLVLLLEDGKWRLSLEDFIATAFP